MRVAGLLLNFLALIPAAVMMTLFGALGSAVVALNKQGASETQSSAQGVQTKNQDGTDEQRLHQGVQEFDEICRIPDKRERDLRVRAWMRKYLDLVKNVQQNIREAAADDEPAQAKEERRTKVPAETKRRAEAERKAEEENNRRRKEEAESQRLREKAEVERRAKESEISAASKLKFAKSLHSASLDAEGRESARLEGEYVNSLHEIIKKYPMTTAAKEAKELLDKMAR